MSQVAILDPLVAQQVAAGEVVDRPASVVKELSENALDAGATRIEVEIADGGRERMLVRDNGSGMLEEDAKLSVLSHATSKIRTASDIESVMTMGFRGEALPSIASVSAFSLTTSTGEGAGTSVMTDGGGEATVSPASHPKGTTVLVDRLFYNVPARRAFLKSARAERAAIVEVMTNLAIAHPQVMFRLVEQTRGTAPGMSREERILATIACHSAVKLGDKLTHKEMEALIKEWLTSRYPATCPHGRSMCYRLEHKDIARKLDRH